MATLPRVMFVDDEPLVLEGLKRALRPRAKSWSMSFATDPKAALAAFQANPCDVVVSDLAMSDMNGIELVLEMKKAASSCAFIMLTGTADLPRAVAAINQAQVFRFFTKPCVIDLLIEGIEAALADSAVRQKASAPVQPRGALPTLTASIGLAALNRVGFGVMVVDAKARVLLTNRSGGEILTARDGLVLASNEIIRTAIPTATERLHLLIRTAASGAGNDDDSIGMAVERPSHKRPLSVLLSSAPEAGSDGHGPLAVLFVSDPDRQPLPDADMIGKLFDLTPSESRLVHALTEGLRLDDAAARCGLTTSTARTYLKRVFGKTGTRRQHELVKLILASPASAN